MVYLVGVDHQVQHNGQPMTPKREEATRAFYTFLELKAKDLNISMFAEEFNDDALRNSCASAATVRDLAHRLGLKHRFCEPTRQERKELGISKDRDRREQFWLSCLEPHLNSETILFVCGADHLESFQNKLLGKGVKAKILPEQYGIGLAPLVITEQYGNFLDL